MVLIRACCHKATCFLIFSNCPNIIFFFCNGLKQWFSNLSYKHPCPAHFVCIPYQTHLIQFISLLVETARPELGVSDKGDIQNVQGRGACRTGLKTTGLKHLCLSSFQHLLIHKYNQKGSLFVLFNGPELTRTVVFSLVLTNKFIDKYCNKYIAD